MKTLFRGLPIITIIASALCVVGYHNNLYDSLKEVKKVISIENNKVKVNTEKSYDYFGKILEGTQGNLQSKFVLENTEINSIPNSLELTLYYLGIFVFAELSFILMSLKEYLQDILNLEDDKKMIQNFFKRNNLRVSQKYYTKKIANESFESLKHLEKAQVYYELGNTLAKLEKYNEAIDNYDHAIKLNENYIDNIDNYDHAIKLKENSYAAYLQKARCYHQLGDRDMAESTIKKLISKDSSFETVIAEDKDLEIYLPKKHF